MTPYLSQSENSLGSECDFANLDQITNCPSEWDEERRNVDNIPIESDDVNGLSLDVDRQTSYLGASSIKAALMVMLKVQPQLRDSLATPLDNVEMANNLPVIRHQPTTLKENARVPWSWKGQTLIDSYFKRVHVFIPMLDETTFRSDYLEGQRDDAPWLALLNMVFAMGNVVAMKSDDFGHINFYNKAMEHLTVDVFGSSHIETVQALAIVGGYYLHYINRPNMANAVLGATIRMATALGLHRESLIRIVDGASVAETRRRTWWSLFCLDTWATTTLGRPSLGRWGSAINIQPPEFGLQQGRDSAQHAGVLPLIENIKFCKIATQIQDRLAVTPLLSAEERCNMDTQLVGWYENLPWLLRTTDPCAEPLYLVRSVMKWRYQNLRMLLHRPTLLSLASNDASVSISEADCATAETCRKLAKSTIEDISKEWARNQMSGWNAVWFLYQAAMIPLVSIFWQWNSVQVPEWQKQVETVIELLEVMEDWSLAAKRSREVVYRMYEASRQPSVTLGDASLQRSVIEQGLMMTNSDFHMSLVGAGTDEVGDMVDQHCMWDLDTLQWPQSHSKEHSPDSGVFMTNNDAIMPMDFATMGDLQSQILDPSFAVFQEGQAISC